MFVDGRRGHVSEIQSFIHQERLRKRTPRSRAPLGWKIKPFVSQTEAGSAGRIDHGESSTNTELDIREAIPGNRSLLTTIEREVIHVDPFNSLPIALDDDGQSLYTFSTQHWESNSSSSTYNTPALVRSWGPFFPYETPLRLCTTLLATSAHLDSSHGTGVSIRTIRWKMTSIQTMNGLISDPVTRYGDEAMLGILTLLLNDALVPDNQKQSHIHSRALLQLVRRRRSPECYSMCVNYYAVALSILTSKASLAYLDHLGAEPADLEEVKLWKETIDFVVSTLRNLSGLVLEMQQSPQHLLTAYTDIAFLRLLQNMSQPRDEFESSRQIFILCYLVLLLRDYRETAPSCTYRIREIDSRYQGLDPEGGELPNLFWVCMQCVDGDLGRKWKALLLTKVIHRVSDKTRSSVMVFLLGVLGAVIGSAEVPALSEGDFSNITNEALADLPPIPEIKSSSSEVSI